MLANIAEKQMNRVRWLLTIGWIILIISLFYDPISAWLTEPTNLWSPLSIDLDNCVEVQGKCLPEQPYSLGAPLFWGLIVPSGIFILLVFGHEFWRRICPLSFLSQIPRAMGWERKRKRTDKKTGKVRYELVKISKNSWVARNHLYLQFGLLFLGICIRILFVNSNRIALGTFLLITIAAAITVGFLYGGKSWCQYFCPMAPVQRVFGEPRGLLNSTAHEGERKLVTQSMCRTVSKDGKELSACVACNSPCIDIDAERSYWDGITQPQLQWLYYGYAGLVVGYFVYYYLYAGNWDYLISGAWSHEEQWANLLAPGFHLLDRPVAIPKIIAVPLTLAIFTLGGYWLGRIIEKRYKAYLVRHHKPVSNEIVRHRLFTLCTFFCFNFFFVFSAKSYVKLLPLSGLFPILIAVCSSLWLYRSWQRNPEVYQKESLAVRLRKQLNKMGLNVSQFLEGRSLEDLNTDEVYVLAKVIPDFSQEKKLQTYREVLRESLQDGYIKPANSLENFKQLRQELGISVKEHEAILNELAQKYPDLFTGDRKRSREQVLRLKSYRETLLETILAAWQEHPEKIHVANLMRVFSQQTSPEAIDELLQNLSTSELKEIQHLRQEYSITKDEETKALKNTDPDSLWQWIADKIGLLDYLDGDRLLEVFQQIDRDSSGYLTVEELNQYIRALDPQFTIEQIGKMLKRADTNSDNLVSYPEFAELFSQLKS